jgi:hypothetical protein
MSILRNQIPKPLDLNFIIECISNPVLNNTINNRILSASSNRTSLTNKENENEYSNIPKPQLFNTQTNDGTNCVYYTNGSLAILTANVFGFCFENSTSNTTNPGSSLSMASTNMINNLTGFGNTSATPPLSYQNLKSSYTTIVYDYVPKRLFSNNSFKSKRSNSLMNSSLGMYNDKEKEKEKQEALLFNLSMSSEKNKLNLNKSKINKENNLNQNANKYTIKKDKNETHLLAVLAPSGNCVCYRKNGKPRFFCTETGGCLVNSKGVAFYQWKWDDQSTIDDRVRDELSSDVILIFVFTKKKKFSSF